VQSNIKGNGLHVSAEDAMSIVDLSNALELDQPDILGWSQGGYLALIIITQFGDSFGKVVIADAHGRWLNKEPCSSLVWHVTVGMPSHQRFLVD